MIIGAVDTEAGSTVAEGVVDFQEEEDLLLVRIEAGARCLKPYAVTVEKSAKSPLDPLVVNRFIAAIVSKKWVAEDLNNEGLMTGVMLPGHKMVPI